MTGSVHGLRTDQKQPPWLRMHPSRPPENPGDSGELEKTPSQRLEGAQDYVYENFFSLACLSCLLIILSIVVILPGK
jgi:hypothetical protein